MCSQKNLIQNPMKNGLFVYEMDSIFGARSVS